MTRSTSDADAMKKAAAGALLILAALARPAAGFVRNPPTLRTDRAQRAPATPDLLTSALRVAEADVERLTNALSRACSSGEACEAVPSATLHSARAAVETIQTWASSRMPLVNYCACFWLERHVRPVDLSMLIPEMLVPLPTPEPPPLRVALEQVRPWRMMRMAMRARPRAIVSSMRLAWSVSCFALLRWVCRSTGNPSVWHAQRQQRLPKLLDRVASTLEREELASLPLDELLGD